MTVSICCGGNGDARNYENGSPGQPSSFDPLQSYTWAGEDREYSKDALACSGESEIAVHVHSWYGEAVAKQAATGYLVKQV